MGALAQPSRNRPKRVAPSAPLPRRRANVPGRAVLRVDILVVRARRHVVPPSPVRRNLHGVPLPGHARRIRGAGGICRQPLEEVQPCGCCALGGQPYHRESVAANVWGSRA
eukprot:15442909-Alexandrium_andersonii.AAC.1